MSKVYATVTVAEIWLLRAPYCVLSFEAVKALRVHGRKARRLEDGVPEWRAAGHPVATDLEERRGGVQSSAGRRGGTR